MTDFWTEREDGLLLEIRRLKDALREIRDYDSFRGSQLGPSSLPAEDAMRRIARDALEGNPCTALLQEEQANQIAATAAAFFNVETTFRRDDTDDDGRWFVYVPGDISDDREWAKMLAFRELYPEIANGISVVYGTPPEDGE